MPLAKTASKAKKSLAKAPVKKTSVKKPVAAKAKAAANAGAKKPVDKKAPAKAHTKLQVKKAAPLVKKSGAAKPVAKAAPALRQVVNNTKPVARKAAAATKTPVATKPVASLASNKALPQKPAAAAPAAKPVKSEYRVGSHVVYPTHGVGKIMAEESQKVGDYEIRVFVIAFDKDKMILRVPVHRAAAAGLRQISSGDELQKAFSTLKGRARASRGMWSRRAQEYEAKINSGNIVSIAEVVRDLHRNVDQSERSYSERMIYESAFGRLVGELAAAEALDAKAATDKLIKVLKTQVAA